MAIPSYETAMLPLLKLAADGGEHRIRDGIAALADHFQLNDAERKQLLPTGNAVFDDRISWARTYLKKAGLLQSPRRGFFQITDRGKTCLSQNPDRINTKFLRQFSEFEEWYNPTAPDNSGAAELPGSAETETPEELLLGSYLRLRKQLEAELLSRVKSSSFDFFERLVVRLLTAMGYGGSLADAGKAIGQSGDGGIDGIIKEDKLGLDLLYIQAKRWDNTSVGRPEVQKFVGALHGKRAKKGVFLTTSTFTKDAIAYADSLEIKVILIDGAHLVELMFDYEVGVSTETRYALKRIDSDFFDDEAVLDEASKAATVD